MISSTMARSLPESIAVPALLVAKDSFHLQRAFTAPATQVLGREIFAERRTTRHNHLGWIIPGLGRGPKTGVHVSLLTRLVV